jgi:hypothetical protein
MTGRYVNRADDPVRTLSDQVGERMAVPPARCVNPRLTFACDKERTGNLARWSSPMLDGEAYKILLPDNPDPDIVPRLRDPALLDAFAALVDDLTMIMSQIASGRDADQLSPAGAYRSPSVFT